jgi:hypothetical protein
MKRLLWLWPILFSLNAWATGEVSTYFNIYVPPNNDAVQRNVSVIVTAIYDSTYFEIVDDSLDGDSDDSYAGWLMAGQSYILYIKDNGVNDDALYASGGTLAWDGDHYEIFSNKLIYASMSTKSDWQFDFVPATNKSSTGQRFIVYSPGTSNSNRDLNVFAYEPNTQVTISKISTSSTLHTGKTTVDIDNKSVLAQRTLQPGQDIIYYFQDGRNVMQSGETYLVEANKDVSLQYGALFQNERDGGGYVPSSNGSSSGSQFYFAVPYQVSGEQEIRIVSWEDSVSFALEYYNHSTQVWDTLKNYSLSSLQTADWVGKTEGNKTIASIFRIQTNASRKVSVFAANWLETGNPGTSDIATMVTSANGTTSGQEFIVYLAPPGNETNVVDPFTQTKFNGSYTHVYLFAKDSVQVTVKDLYTNGQDFSRTYQIAKGKYADCALSLNEWKSIYNGTGSTSGPERPYVIIESTGPISVLNTNFNDNWMTYFGSALSQDFSQSSTVDKDQVQSGDTVHLVSSIDLVQGTLLQNTTAEIQVGTGAIPIESTFLNNTESTSYAGTINVDSTGSTVTFDNLPDLNDTSSYSIETELLILSSENDGDLLDSNQVINVETIVSGTIGGEWQQSSSAQGISNTLLPSPSLIFNRELDPVLTGFTENNWNCNWMDYNNDGWEDLFVCNKNNQEKNSLFMNNGDGSFNKLQGGALLNFEGISVSSIWGDVDNDGDEDVVIVNSTESSVRLYENNAGNFQWKQSCGLNPHPAYSHGGGLADIDNDGDLDLLLCGYLTTQFNELYLNDGTGQFQLVTGGDIDQIITSSVAPSWSDYDNDGWTDVFIPNGKNMPSKLYRNTGSGFTDITPANISNPAQNSVAACWGDYDNDGWMDLFVANASKEGNRLYRNLGNGSFQSVHEETFGNLKGNSHGCAFADFNNDGYLDLYVTDDQGQKLIFVQDSSGFVLRMQEPVYPNYGQSYGFALSDFDKDGDLDMYVANHSGDANGLFTNQTQGKNWLQIHLIGTNSNKEGIGCKLRIKSGGKWQTREHFRQAGFGSQNSKRVHFGLGTDTSIDSLIVRWPSGYQQVLTQLNVNQFISITEDDAALVSGRIFFDEDSDCSKDSLESSIGGILVRIEPTGIICSTDSEGKFYARLAVGTYQLFVAAQDYWTSSCTTRSFSVDSIGQQVALDPFGLGTQQLGHDLHLSGGSTDWRRGFKNHTRITAQNKGTAGIGAPELSVTYPNGMYLCEADPIWDIQVGNTYIWQLDSLGMGESTIVHIKDSVGLEKSIGDTIAISMNIAPTTSDLDSTNNQFVLQQQVVGAIDPNDILVFPRGRGDRHYIDPDQALRYKIRFQNVGNYYASFVRIHAGIHENLDPNSLELLELSHSASFTVYPNGQMEWYFDQIMLPDSTANEAESHGYIEYILHPRAQLSPEDVITAKARIQFDFEDPLETNEVWHTISGVYASQSFPLRISPNPANQGSWVKVEVDSPPNESRRKIVRVDVYNNYGQLLQSAEPNTMEWNFIPEGMTDGSLIIRAVDQFGSVHQGTLIMH